MTNEMRLEEQLINYFYDCLNVNPENIGDIGNTIPIPTYSDQEAIQISEKAANLFKNTSPMLEINSPVYIVGDLHGNIIDFLRILIMAGSPPASKFLFLGDFVDRGEYSIELTVLLFSFAILYPKNVYLIRGNHEFRKVNEVYGFKDQCIETYGSLEVYEAINRAFDYLPLAAIINEKIFCVHGGISPRLNSLQQIKDIKRPCQSCDDQALKDLLWSDPDKNTEWYSESSRGDGVLYGTKAVAQFLNKFNFSRIVRAHQCVKLGIERFSGDTGLTVFSSSSYDNAGSNRCGLLFVTMDSAIQTFSLPPVSPVLRECAFLQRGRLIAAAPPESELRFPACQRARELPALRDGAKVKKKGVRSVMSTLNPSHIRTAIATMPFRRSPSSNVLC